MIAINTRIFHKVFYDIPMLKIKQLFVILTTICYDTLMLKSLCRIMLKMIDWIGYPYAEFMLESYHNVKLVEKKVKDNARRHKTKAAK